MQQQHPSRSAIPYDALATTMLRGARTDSLGVSAITYWPTVTVTEAS